MEAEGWNYNLNQPSLTRKKVDEIVAATFFGGMSEKDNNLQFVRDMLTQRAPNVYSTLTSYKDIWRGHQRIEDAPRNRDIVQFRPAG